MKYTESECFHEQYYSLYDSLVVVVLKDGTQIQGLFNDEFYEDNSILVDCKVIKIGDIEKMVALDKY